VLPLDPSQLIQSASFDRMLKGLAERADIVLFDAPPLLAVAETTPLSLKVDGLVLVTRVGVVPRSALADLARVTAMSPTPTLGIVVTGVSDVSASGYGPYGYGETGGRAERRRVLFPRPARTT
jgi:Mrp family chromosome partitioning ATPase